MIIAGIVMMTPSNSQKLKDWFKAYMTYTRSPHFWLVLILVIIFAIFFLGPFLVLVQIHFASIVNVDSTISKIVSNIPLGNTSEETTKNILDWQEKQMRNSITVDTPFLNKLCKSVQLFDPNIVFILRCGACGEYTYAFMELSKRMNLTTRQIYNCGIDHTWAEVLINKTWVPVETTEADGFNISYLNDCGYTSALSYVYVNADMNDDITSKYICSNDTALLAIHASPNSQVVITTNQCEIKLLTNKDGDLNIRLGPGKYTASMNSYFYFSDTQSVLAESSETVVIHLIPKPDLSLIITTIPTSVIVVFILSYELFRPKIPKSHTKK